MKTQPAKHNYVLILLAIVSLWTMTAFTFKGTHGKGHKPTIVGGVEKKISIDVAGGIRDMYRVR